jgi:hypothetical protein
MLNICDDIEEAGIVYANLAHKYAHAAIYGNETEKLFFTLVRLNFYIEVMERNMPMIVTEKTLTPPQGNKVSLSSLTKQNNNLILEQKYYCTKTECRPCLSDEELCSIVEKAKLLYSCI